MTIKETYCDFVFTYNRTQQRVYNKLLKNTLAARNTRIQHTLLSIQSYVKGCKKEEFLLTNQDKFQRRRLV